MFRYLHTLPTRLRWSCRLLWTRFFVVLVDTESFMFLGQVDTDSFHDSLSLVSQRQAIQDFQQELEQLILKHDAALAALYNKPLKQRK